jgi:hypothetical protein
LEQRIAVPQRGSDQEERNGDRYDPDQREVGPARAQNLRIAYVDPPKIWYADLSEPHLQDQIIRSNALTVGERSPKAFKIAMNLCAALSTEKHMNSG